MNNRKRLLSLLMTLVLLIGLLPGDAFAAECSHVWGAKTYDSTPTCFEPGSYVQYCTKCGDARDGEDYGPHAWGSWSVTKESTCIQDGQKSRTCSACGQTETQSTGKADHKWDSWWHDRLPTCTTNGTDAHRCKVCDRKETKDVPPLGHDFGPWTIITAPQYDQPGLEERRCARCEAFEQREIPALHGDVSVVKSITNTPADGVSFKAGEVISYSITVSNQCLDSIYDVDVRDPLCAQPELLESCPSIPAGSSITRAFDYVVTADDFTAGQIVNTAYADWSPIDDGGKITTPSNTLTTTIGEMNWEAPVSIALSGTPANGLYFLAGETAHFTITYANPTPFDLTILSVDGVIKDHPSYTETPPALYTAACVSSGTLISQLSGSASFSYTITDADVQSGMLYAGALFSTEQLGTSQAAFVSVPCSAASYASPLTVEWACVNSPANGLFFTPDEVIQYSASVTNETEHTVYYMTGEASMGMAGVFVNLTLAPGETVRKIYNWTVSTLEADAGSLTSYLHASGCTAEDRRNDAWISGRSLNVTVPCGHKAPPLYDTAIDLSCLSTDSGIGAQVGDVLNARMQVRNIGSTTVSLEQFHFTDLSSTHIPVSFNWNSSQFSPLYTWFPAGGSLTANLPIVVTQSDVDAGKVTRTFTQYAIPYYCDVGGEATDIPAGIVPTPDGTSSWHTKGDELISVSVRITIPLALEDTGLSDGLSLTKQIESTPANGQFFVPGETVAFRLNVKNTTGAPLQNVVIKDALPTQEGDILIDSLAAGQSQSHSATYVVTTLDATSCLVNNVAYVSAIDAAGNMLVEYSNAAAFLCGFTADGTVPLPEAPFGVFADLAITKEVESLPLYGAYYSPYEQVAYRITYTNAGEVTLNNVTIYDPLYSFSNEIASAESLAPGESRTCRFSYTVTEADAASGFITNVAVGEYTYGQNAGSSTSNSVTVYTAEPTAENFNPWYEFDSVIGSTGGFSSISIPPFRPIAPAFPKWDPDSSYGYVGGSPITGVVYTPDIGYASFYTGTLTLTPESGAEPVRPNFSRIFGSIDTARLKQENEYCVRTLTGRDNASAVYDVNFCPTHTFTHASTQAMLQAASAPAMQSQAAAYVTALWQEAVKMLYQHYYDASDSLAKTVVMTEYLHFKTYMTNYETLLNAMYPGDPAAVSLKVADMWQDKCVTLCSEMHASPDHPDSLLRVTAQTGASAVECRCETSAVSQDAITRTQTFCPRHAFPFALTDTLLRGEDSAASWTGLRQIWMIELSGVYHRLMTAAEENAPAIEAEYDALMQWMMSREATLLALYPDQPEWVAQSMVKFIIDHIGRLCVFLH